MERQKIIKVVTGVRRCGKSTLLEEFQTKLLQGGVDIGQIISLNFEDLYYEDLLDYRKLYNFLQKKIITGKPTYIFLDKIQRVSQFEKVFGYCVILYRSQTRHLPHGIECLFAF